MNNKRVNAVVFSAVLFAVTIALLTPMPANAFLREYSKEYDAGRDILLLSPSSNIVVVEKGGYIVFRVMVFSSDVNSVSLVICNKVYRATELSRNNNSLPRIFEVKVPVKYTDIYSWKIIITYHNGLSLTTCTGTIFVIVAEQLEQENSIVENLAKNIWISPSIV